MTMKAEERLYEKLGLDFHIPDSGCCGMAGSFGFEKEHYSISAACGERKLLPEVRKAGEETIVVADGFSCREQISQLTNRKARHTAEMLRMAIHGRTEPEPESAATPDSQLAWSAVSAGALAGVAAGWLIGRLIRH
jgi:hypothetical protein